MPTGDPHPIASSLQVRRAAPSTYSQAIGAIILAAGLSSRMVENKVLLPWRDGLPIVRHVAQKYVLAAGGPVIVVTGRDAAQVCAAVSDLDLSCAHNPDFATGEMLSSLKVGLRALSLDLKAAFIQPADMPCVPRSLPIQLAKAHERGWNVAPQCDGRRGHPVLLDRAYWGAMLALPAGAKPRAVVEAARERLRLIDVDDRGVLLDLDTPQAYEGVIGRTV